MRRRNVVLAGSAILVLLALAGCSWSDDSPGPEPARLVANIVLQAPLGSGPDDLGLSSPRTRSRRSRAPTGSLAPPWWYWTR